MLYRSFLVLCGATCAAAQPHSLTVDDAIRVAWANDPAVAALALYPEIAHAREEQAGIRPNPEVEFRGSTSAPLKNDSEWGVGVGVTQRLPRRERVEQARAFARLSGETAALHLHEQRRRVAGEVRRLAYEVAIQQARRDLAQRLLAAQREHRAAMERRQTAGEVPAFELDLLAIETTRAEHALALTEAELTAALLRLRGRLRLAGDAPFTLALDLDTVISRAIPAEPSTLDTSRPMLALADHAVRQTEAGLALARAETRGEWTVGAGADFERRANDATGRLENEPRLNVNASVPWPRTVANRGDIREKQAAVRVAEAELAALRQDVRAEIHAALAAVRVLQPVLAAQRPALTSSEPVPVRLRAAYERGEVTSLQLAQARQQRFALEAEFLNAAARYAAALAEAETVVGVIPATQP